MGCGRDEIERSKSVKFCDSAKVNQIHLGFIPKNKCSSPEISEYEIRCHITEEEKVNRKKQRSIIYFFVNVFYSIDILLLGDHIYNESILNNLYVSDIIIMSVESNVII